MKTDIKDLPVAVIGAGPVGLAAAAHLLQNGFTPIVLEAGDSVAANLASYRQVHLFSPWRFNLDHAASALLRATGWQEPDLDGLPTAGEIIDTYLQPLVSNTALHDRVLFGHSVLAISRLGYDKVKTKGREQAPFVIRTQTSRGEQDFLAQAVIDASGTWSQANPLGANGLFAEGEQELAAHITYGMPDVLGTHRARYAGKRVLVVGAGHSAAGNLLALAQLAEEVPGTSIVWAIRGNQLEKIYGGGSADGLSARGELGTRLKALQETGRLELHQNFRIKSLQREGQGITIIGEIIDGEQFAPRISNIAEVLAATGARPDLSLTRELRVRHDPWLESTDALAPLIDPNVHSCGTVRPHGHRELAHPESGYYAVGAKSYGRAPNFLMATGYEQVRSIVAALRGDLAAADDVRLELPETGVCFTRNAAPAESDSCGSSGSGRCHTSSCATSAKVQTSACCGPVQESKPAQTSSSCCA
jgi:hypothetical protein